MQDAYIANSVAKGNDYPGLYKKPEIWRKCKKWLEAALYYPIDREIEQNKKQMESCKTALNGDSPFSKALRSKMKPEEIKAMDCKLQNEIDALTVEEMINTYISPSREREVFSGIWPKMYYADAQRVGHSLEVLLVSNLTLNTQLNIYGKPKTKADFWMNGVHFRDFSVTDRSYYGQDGDVRNVGKACIVCSIADDQKAKEIGYYKFISAIYELH